MKSKFFITGMIVFALCVFTARTALYYSMDDVVIATVTDKERIVESSGDEVQSKYLIFTDKETFENSDLVWVGKFDSSDLQGQLQIGQTYQFKVYGWRIGFPSSYRNIAGATLYVDEEEGVRADH